MDRGVWGEGGEGAPASYARTSCARSATRVLHARGSVRGGLGGRENHGGRLTSVNGVALVCGPVLGLAHAQETRDPCNHQRDHEGDRLRACPGRRPPGRHPDRRHRCTRGRPACPGTCGPDPLGIHASCPRHLRHDAQAPHRRAQGSLVPRPEVGPQPQVPPAGRASPRVLPGS
nr:MAG TPA: hypothetical protein [Caudoviricetes sp.]